MKPNKPKYTLFKNATYALEGFIEITKHESSFKLQLLLFVVMNIVAWVLNIGFMNSAMLSLSLFIPIIAEVTNSAIERVVDLVTVEHHIMAKRAKDAGATLVLLSLVLTACIWIVILLDAFKLV
ncbi:diacylglycerol kinase [Sulfurimonas sp. HSL-1716]|uniref:diacylglycerol kinase n=1 Tax=Hydrocurvibacter sulfurireducens TaxID=3131937 RepID=UPI0031F83EAD